MSYGDVVQQFKKLDGRAGKNKREALSSSVLGSSRREGPQEDELPVLRTFYVLMLLPRMVLALVSPLVLVWVWASV